MQKLIKIIKDAMTKITVSNVVYTGQNITISNNRVIIDGVDVTPDSKNIEISVDGDINILKASSGNATVNGSVKEGISTKSGDIEVDGNINGSVSTMSGDIECGNILGNVSTKSGDISRGNGKRF